MRHAIFTNVIFSRLLVALALLISASGLRAKMLGLEGKQHQLQIKRDGVLLTLELKTRRLL